MIQDSDDAGDRDRQSSPDEYRHRASGDPWPPQAQHEVYDEHSQG